MILFLFAGSSAVAAVTPPLLTFWGPFLDSAPTVGWPAYLDVVRQLKEDGFTHIGVQIWNPSTDVSSQLAGLRALGLPLAFISTAGHRFFTNPAELDPANHLSNNQNLKYFDTPGFDPYQCQGSVGCAAGPHVTAHDPAYAGVVWQKELDHLSTSLDRIGLQSGDVVLFDIEVWAEPGAVEYYYPRVILNSPGRYQGTPAERYAEYRSNWLARARDLVAVVKRRSPTSPVLFYGENQPTYSNSGDDIWMLAGSGDAPAPKFYWLPDLDRVSRELAAAAWSNTYPWTSFSWSNVTRSAVSWDPLKTQKLGWRLRTAGAGGAIVYPGPFDYDVEWNIPVSLYLAHAKALTDGFLRGLDPDAPPAPQPIIPIPIEPIIVGGRPIVDAASPSPIADLRITSVDKKSAILAWTAPQDLSATRPGLVVAYDLRYASDPITAPDWDSAALVSGEPTPALPGATETYTLVDISPGKTYYAALKSQGAAGNVSALSNVVAFATLSELPPESPPPPPPAGGPGGPGGPSGSPQTSGRDTVSPGSPTAVIIQPADRQAVLTWQNPRDPDFVRTMILRSLVPLPVITAPGNPRYLPMVKVVYDGTLLRFTDTNLINGQLYYYTFYAYDRSGNYARPVTLTVRPNPINRQGLILQLKLQLLKLLQKLLVLLRGW